MGAMASEIAFWPSAHSHKSIKESLERFGSVMCMTDTAESPGGLETGLFMVLERFRDRGRFFASL